MEEIQQQCTSPELQVLKDREWTRILRFLGTLEKLNKETPRTTPILGKFHNVYMK